MSEENVYNIKEENSLGQVQIADDVVAIIAGLAASEVEGVYKLAGIYSGILSSTMDAFASVISNNLNSVMKFLATATIVMTVPTVISGFYGMNVNPVSMPFSASPSGFGIVLVFTAVLMLVVILVFSKKDFF